MCNVTGDCVTEPYGLFVAVCTLFYPQNDHHRRRQRRGQRQTRSRRPRRQRRRPSGRLSFDCVVFLVNTSGRSSAHWRYLARLDGTTAATTSTASDFENYRRCFISCPKAALSSLSSISSARVYHSNFISSIVTFPRISRVKLSARLWASSPCSPPV